MAQQQGQGQGDTSGTYDFFWGAAALVAALAIIWYYFHGHLIYALYTFKVLQLELIGLIYESQELASLISYLKSSLANTYSIPIDEVWLILNTCGTYSRWLWLVPLVPVLWYLWFRHPSAHYNESHSIKTLGEQERQNWPQINPVIGQDLLNTDITKGPWAMAQSPMDFARANDLLIKPDLTTRRRKKNAFATIDIPQATQVFSSQLGRKYNGINAMEPYMQALFACFGARGLEIRKEPEKIIKQLATSFAAGDISYAGVIPLLNKVCPHKKIGQIVGKHAYEYTIMASMLEFAREDGVFASADFLWLKTIDRKLWYILNAVGRQTAFPEIGGIFAHWLAEKSMQMPISQPMVEQATSALKLAIEDIIYTEEE